MRTIGCIKPEDVENKHDQLLMEYSRGLPKVARLIERCAIDEGRPFTLTRVFKNFEHISAGQIIAFSGDTPIRAQHDGLILLPRLQNQGNDGFFVVKPEKY
jgi:succinylglutamate desuccinylase